MIPSVSMGAATVCLCVGVLDGPRTSINARVMWVLCSLRAMCGLPASLSIFVFSYHWGGRVHVCFEAPCPGL